MNEETKTQTQTKKKITTKKKLIASVVAILAVAALIAGLTYAWFYNQTDMATLMKISPPSNISILGPGGSELNSLDLNYTADNKDENGNVTVRRVICVQSEISVGAYKLEIVHTTNLKGLTFNLYPVTYNGTGNTVTDGGFTYNYNPDSSSQITGNYLNLDDSASSVSNSYKYANGAQHTTNYKEYTNVQSHAEPLYWLVDKVLSPMQREDDQVTIEGKKYNRTYYVCEVTWTETTKETDIFYILAKTVDQTTGQ